MMTNTLKSPNSHLRLLLLSACIILAYNLAVFAQPSPRVAVSKSSSATEIYIRPKIDVNNRPPAARAPIIVGDPPPPKPKPPLKVEMPEMVPVDGGNFLMGAKGSKSDDGPEHLTLVPTFEISKYPVTNKQFAQFVSETNYKTKAEKEPTDVERKNKISWKTFAGPGREDYPVIWVSYEDAQSYGLWLSSVVKNPPIKEKLEVGVDSDGEPVYQTLEKTHPYRLPTEAEWECAAKGGLKDQPFPWEKVDKEKINYNANNNRESTIQAAKQFIKPVGYQPPNAFGVQDLAGNVAQWCYDYYDPSFYEYSPEPPQKAYGPEKGNEAKERIIRGGSWLDDLDSCRVTSRQSAPQDLRSTQVGFRVVRIIAAREKTEKTENKSQRYSRDKHLLLCDYTLAVNQSSIHLFPVVLLERRHYFTKQTFYKD